MMIANDVRTITDDEAKAQGFEGRMEFLVDWIATHDSEVKFARNQSHPAFWDLSWESVRGFYITPKAVIDLLTLRPADRYIQKREGKPRKYTNVTLHSEVYVDSDQTYHFEVQCDVWGKRLYNPNLLHYQISFGFDNLSNAPRYLKTEVKTKILELLQSPDTKFYEKDRDGWKRYTGLRYHDDESLARQIEWLTETLAQEKTR